MPFNGRMNIVTRAMVAMTAASLVATSAAAQTAPLGDPSVLTTPAFAAVVNAKSIVIYTRDGRNFEGRFKIEGNALVMLDSKTLAVTPTTVPLAEVARVQKSTYRIRQHSLIGLAVGAAGGAVVGGVLCGGDCDGDPFWLALAAVGTGIGAGIGAGNGASQNSRHFDEDVVFDIGQRFAPASGTVPLSRLGTAEFAREIEGKDVWINGADGTRRRGEVGVATASGLVLLGPQHAFVPYDQIATVVEVSHRIRNGVINGAGAGLGIGFLSAYIPGDCYDQSNGCMPQIAAWTAAGAGIGAAVGALMNLDDDRDLLYAAGRRTTTLAVAPIVSKTRKGVSFTVTWR